MRLEVCPPPSWTVTFAEPSRVVDSAMRATIDKAGRLVIPKQLREEVGLRPGEVDVSAYGTGLRVEPVAGEESLDERDGRLVIPAAGVLIHDNLVRSLRDASQR